MNLDNHFPARLTTEWSLSELSVADDVRALAEAAGTVDVIVGGPMPVPIPTGARLRLYHSPYTGHDWITPADLPRGAIFCNTHEHETTIAEHVLAAMLEFQTGLMRETHPVMKARSYDGRSINTGPRHRELRDTTIGIIGYGHIGREVARRCKAFAMTVMALSRNPRPEPGLTDWYGTPDQLETLLGASDFVLVCAPGGGATRGMINARAFRVMKEDSVIINVGRGEVIDEAALFEALSSRRIRGAAIDVWYVYPSPTWPNPWPSRFPFHKLDTMIMSPHSSAWTAEMSDRRWAFVAGNLDRFARDEALINICFSGERLD